MRRFYLLFLFCSFLQTKGQSYPLTGAQVWLEPGQTSRQIDSWFRTLATMEMPVARIFLQWNFIQTSPEQWDFSLFDEAFRAASRYHIKIVATLCPNQPPYFYGKSYYFKNQGDKILSSRTELERATRYIDTVVNHYKNNPALDCWMLMNEPGQEPSPDSLAIERFRNWLKEKYGTIDALNRTWLSAYSSFDSIEYHKAWQEGGWTWPSATIDWYTFWRSHLTWFLSWTAGEIKRHDPIHPLHANPHALFAYLPWYDLPSWANLLDVLGASVHPSWHFYLYPRERYNEAICFLNDLLRGAAGNKPYWITELQGGNNLYSGVFPLCPSPEDITGWLWLSASSGAGRVIFWCLNPKTRGTEAAEWAMLNLSGQPGERLLAASRVAKTFQASEDFFKEARPVTANITLLVSPQTMILEQRIKAPNTKPGTNKDAHLKALLACYRIFHQLGVPVNISGLDNYSFSSSPVPQMIMLPHAISLTEEQIKKIENFVAAGNKVLITGLSGLFDENNTSWFVNRSSPMEKMLGGTLKDIRYAGDQYELGLTYYQLMLPGHLWIGEIDNKTGKVLGMHEDKVVAIKNRYGKGEVIWIPSPVDLGAWLYGTEGLRSLIQDESAPFYASLPFRFSDPQDNVQLRMMQSKDKYLTVLVNSGHETSYIRLKCKVNKKARVISGEVDHLDTENQTITLEAGETMAILWE